MIEINESIRISQLLQLQDKETQTYLTNKGSKIQIRIIEKEQN